MSSSRRTTMSAASLLLVLAASVGCASNQVPAEVPPASQPGSPVTSASAPPATPTPSATDEPADERTAEEILDDISAEVDTASLVMIYTEENDPNKLLGRPNGYTSKIAFADSRINQDEADRLKVEKDAIERGGSIEVFPDEEGAQARADYIQSVQKGGVFGSEYDYVKGGILVRVTGDLTPKQAKEYEAALD